ncbi:alpha/beta hydrolase family protein [Actinomadura sp. HBU206391]|uniref:alpha/beta hydrolase family protein n=1 Tax=Actinomadura sp. HBU206391 TaxID=2731692 RepID=UPI00164FA59A|nr:prolyl oligopeptidase family serine peptidase [Actinomadura sp. HBU206391]MBC6459919.1 prolyl oligopeptidase family serine peptidase [Actinomadura sp. HBU206391]
MSPEWERREEAPDRSAWATVRTPALASIAEHNPAAVRWRDLVIDPDLAGLVPGRARPSSIVIADGGGEWRLPLDGVLPGRLAWHPRRPLVAGLAVRGRRAHVWTADRRARTVTVHAHLRAAVSFTAYGHPPVAWCGDDRLAFLVPGPHRDAVTGPPDGRPVVFEAAGPGVVSFEPPPEELERLAGARLAVADLRSDADAGRPLTPPMLVRSLLPAPAGNAVLVTHGRWAAEDEGLRWTDALVDLDAPGTPRPLPAGSEYARLLAPPPSSPDATAEPTATTGTGTGGGAGVSIPTVSIPAVSIPAVSIPAVSVPMGAGSAALTLPPAEAGRLLLLWIRAFPPGADAPCEAPIDLDRADHPVATLDLPLNWPADATLGMLHAQIIGAVEAARKHWDGPVAVGGHSFGATLALYALANIPGLVSAVVHSGCYNRTLTPMGFHYEKRPYWTDPTIYHAFSALHFADRLGGPVLLVHGAEDGNPATPPEQSVELYRAIVAAGGRARLVLLPYEGHEYRYRETHRAVADEHRAWMARW